MSKAQIDYQDYYVAYVDVLGFSELVQQSSSKKDVRASISLFYQRIRQAFDRFKRIETKAQMYSIAISDTVVLAMPALAIGKDPRRALRELCVAVGTIQWDMARHGIWMRGGIARGDFWADQEHDQIVGPAYLTAYKLEQYAAKYPRVVLDTELIPKLKFTNRKSFVGSFNKEFTNDLSGNWTTDILFNWGRPDIASIPLREDYPLFVDYLSPSMMTENDEMLETIISKLESGIYSGPGYEKLKWVALYLAAHFRSSKMFADYSSLFERLQAL